MAGKMMGCRVPDELDKKIRNHVKKNGTTVNELLNEVLGKEFNGLPAKKAKTNIANDNVTSENNDVSEISREILERKERIVELKNLDNGLFGDSDIDACVEALEIEIEEYVALLPKREEIEGIFS